MHNDVTKRQAKQGGFVIGAPGYAANSAGVYCVYKLCEELRKRGFTAYTTLSKQGAKHIDAPLIDVDSARRLCSLGFTAIYPETIPGNPLHAKTVIRWVLNRPGLLGGDKVYDPDEIVFCYAEAYKPYIVNKVAGMLYMPTIDTSIFHATDWDLGKRKLECFYVGKSKWRSGVCDPRSTFEITREIPRKKDLGPLLRASRVLYCFDNSTSLVCEALMCGCPVVIVPDGTQTRADFERQELGLDGIAWGPEEFTGKPVDVPALRRRYDHIQKQFETQLMHLIDVSGQKPGHVIHSVDTGPILDERDRHAPESSELHNEGSVAPIRLGRRIERVFRRWRKDKIDVLRQHIVRRRVMKELRSLAKDARDRVGEEGRTLECVYYGNGKRSEAGHDEGERPWIVVHDGMSACQLVALFRVSKTLYCFADNPFLQEAALVAGCSVRAESPPERYAAGEHASMAASCPR